MGGLGVTDIVNLNKCLLTKWLWKLENSDGLWQTVVIDKYLRNSSFSQCTREPSHFHFWQGLMNVSPLFYC
jgi:hypothetical protein